MGQVCSEPVFRIHIVYMEWCWFSCVICRGIFPVQNVDLVDPIIAVDCNTGSGIEITTATAPPVDTLAGSQVVRIFFFFGIHPIDDQSETIVDLNGDMSASFITQEVFDYENLYVSRLVGDTELVYDDGPTGEATAELATLESTQWRACTIALRMGQGSGGDVSVPALSEWGLIAAVGVLGLAGLITIRRRRSAA